MLKLLTAGMGGDLPLAANDKGPPSVRERAQCQKNCRPSEGLVGPQGESRPTCLVFVLTFRARRVRPAPEAAAGAAEAAEEPAPRPPGAAEAGAAAAAAEPRDHRAAGRS